MHEVLDAPDAVGGVRRPWRELLGERADVGPLTAAGGLCEGGGSGAESLEVEGGEERGGEDDEAVAVEGLFGCLVGIGGIGNGWCAVRSSAVCGGGRRGCGFDGCGHDECKLWC